MANSLTGFLVIAIPMFCFGYPFVMSWYWMVGGLMFYVGRERFMAPPEHPLPATRPAPRPRPGADAAQRLP